MYDATGIICDDELSPAQMTNLEEALEVKIMDRTLVILDILRQERIRVRVRYRLNWRSLNIVRRDL